MSEAIATGRVLARPGTCLFVRESDGGLTACALGMATLAVSINKYDYHQKWPWLREKMRALPCGCKYIQMYDSAITHLFDIHVMEGDWTLDQLIDWVRSVEPAEATPQTEQAIAESAARVEVVAKRSE